MVRSPAWAVMVAMAVAVSSLAAEPRPRVPSATTVAAAASLQAAQADLDRLQSWHQHARDYLLADIRLVAAVRAARGDLHRLAMCVMDGDAAAWASARSALKLGDLENMLAKGATGLDAAVQNGSMEPAQARHLQELQQLARSGIAAFELAVPARPSQAEWDTQRDRLFAAVRAQDAGLAALDAAHTENQRVLQLRIGQAEQQLAVLPRTIRLLQAPMSPASAARSTP